MYRTDVRWQRTTAAKTVWPSLYIQNNQFLADKIYQNALVLAKE